MNLARVLREYRWAVKADLRKLSASIGISASTFSRIERGEIPSGKVLALLLMWLLREDNEGQTEGAIGEAPKAEVAEETRYYKRPSP